LEVVKLTDFGGGATVGARYCALDEAAVVATLSVPVAVSGGLRQAQPGFEPFSLSLQAMQLFEHGVEVCSAHVRIGSVSVGRPQVDEELFAAHLKTGDLAVEFKHGATNRKRY
jgi:hypothetical protein